MLTPYLREGCIRGLALVALLSSTIACGLDKQGMGVSIDPANLLQKLETEYRSYNLSQVAPYDTVTLKVRGVSGTGMTIDAPVVYGYNDRYVTVSPSGLLKAVSPVSNTLVTVTMTFGGSTRVDTIRVSVIHEAPQQLQRVAIALNVGDSAKTSGTAAKLLPLIRESSGGTNLGAVLVSLRSSDTTTATIAQVGNNVQVTPIHIGRVMLYVSTYAYGIGIQDSLPFLVGWPIFSFVGSYARYDRQLKTEIIDFKGGDLTVGMGACVIWLNMSDTLDLDIVFEDPSSVLSNDSSARDAQAVCRLWGRSDTSSTGKPLGENIAPWRKEVLPNGGGDDFFSIGRSRVFRKAGVYRYRSLLNGSTGTVTVCDEKNDRTCSPETYQWGFVKP